MEDFSNMIPCEICSQHVLFDEYADHTAQHQNQQINGNPAMNSLMQLFQQFQNPPAYDEDDTSDNDLENGEDEMEVDGAPIANGDDFQEALNYVFQNFASTSVRRDNIPEDSNLPRPNDGNLDQPITQADLVASQHEFNTFQELRDFLTREGFTIPPDPHPNQNPPPETKFKFYLTSYKNASIACISGQVQPQPQPAPIQPQPEAFLFEFYHPPPMQNLGNFNFAFPQANQQPNNGNIFQQIFNIFPRAQGGNVAGNYDYFMNLAEQIGNVEIGVKDIEKVAPLITSDEIDALNNEQKICVVCQDDVASDCRKTLCNHYFCSACIQPWLDKHKTCPVCLTDLEEKLASQ